MTDIQMTEVPQTQTAKPRRKYNKQTIEEKKAALDAIKSQAIPRTQTSDDKLERSRLAALTYYYKNREEICEKRRIARLKKASMI